MSDLTNTASTGFRLPLLPVSAQAVLVIMFLVIPQVWILSLLHQEPPATALALEHTEFIADNASVLPPASDARWQSQDLPDDWLRNHGTVAFIWYRMALDLTNGWPQTPVVYLPSVNMNAAVFMNGKFIGDGGRFTDPTARNWNRPLLFEIPVSLLQPGVNTLAIRLKADPPGSGLLGKVYFGDRSLLEPVYQQRFFIRVNLVWGIVIGLTLLFLFFGAVWLMRPQETMYGWFALIELVWVFQTLNFLLVDIPFSAPLWDWLTRYGCLCLLVSFSIIFVNRYIGRPQPRVEAGFALVYATVMLGLLIIDTETFYLLGRRIMSPFLLVGALYLSYRLWYAFRTDRKPEYGLVLLTALVTTVFSASDALMANQLWSRLHGFSKQYGALLETMIFSWFLIRRFVNALNEAETLSRELEQRVQEKHRELEDNYRKLRDLERERALSEERERLMQDMHDGVGGQLVGALTMLDRDHLSVAQIRDHLRNSLTDLRMMIDSLDPEIQDLPTLLGTLRLRLRQQLEAAQVKLLWQVTDLPLINNFGPRKALHVIRIVQEAITNSLKHSGAQTIRVSTGESLNTAGQAGIWLEVADDGAGLKKESLTVQDGGRGLANMRARTASLDAKLTVNSSDQGTLVRLWLPLDSNEHK